MINWCQINFWRKFSFLEAFQVLCFFCHSERRPDFEISDVTEWNLDHLLTPVFNFVFWHQGCSDWPVTLMFPEMASQHCQGRSRWSQAFPQAACQQSQSWACNLLLKTKIWAELTEFSQLFTFFNVVLNLTQKKDDFSAQRLSTCFSLTCDA